MYVCTCVCVCVFAVPPSKDLLFGDVRYEESRSMKTKLREKLTNRSELLAGSSLGWMRNECEILLRRGFTPNLAQSHGYRNGQKVLLFPLGWFR